MISDNIIVHVTRFTYLLNNRLHDYDNNERLDGLEVMAAISHVMPHDPDLDLGKLGEGHVLTQEQQRALTIAKDGYQQQINHFISKSIQFNRPQT